jgi:hypothetical protein
MNWQKTRQIILTIDPKLFRDGQESYELVKQKKAISQFILEVKRGLGVNMKNMSQSLNGTLTAILIGTY